MPLAGPGVCFRPGTFICQYTHIAPVRQVFILGRLPFAEIHTIILLFNHCRIIDLGVMTPCDKILKTALQENAGVHIYIRMLGSVLLILPIIDVYYITDYELVFSFSCTIPQALTVDSL